MQRKMTKATNWISEWVGEVWSERKKKKKLSMSYKKKKAMNSLKEKSENLATALCPVSLSLNGINTPILRRVSDM